MVFNTHNSTQHINSYPVQVKDDLYCSAVEATDQGLCSEMVYATYDYTSHINNYPVQVENDLYCSAIQVIDQGLCSEMVCTTHNSTAHISIDILYKCKVIYIAVQ